MRRGYARANALNNLARLVPEGLGVTVSPMRTSAFPRSAFLLAAVMAVMPARAADPAASLQSRVEARLAEAGPGTRFGLVVTDGDGREIISIDPQGRFIPASNTKMLTTAAAFFALADIDQPDGQGGASVRLETSERGVPDVVLVGHGDARLSSADDCVTDCLATLADAVAARTRVVGNVVGDDSYFPDERWSSGMSWNNIPTRSGTGISALTLDDNELVVTVSPGRPGGPPAVRGIGYEAIDNRAITVPAGGHTELGHDRLPLTATVRLTGTIAAGAAPERIRMGIDDPARYAAWRLRAMLIARGVRVTGAVQTRHRPPAPDDDPKVRRGAPVTRAPQQPALARLTPPPVIEDLTHINKVSQNLHAELTLRRIARQTGSGSVADGLAEIERMMTATGAARTGWDLSDGSGMSTYNRLSPRAVVTLLRWIASQPWGGRWRDTLPVGGVDGTLARRFKGTPLERKIYAKTGSLNATSALSGYLVARSGRTLVFSSFANDMPADTPARAAVDSALVMIAEAN